ncbi:Kinetochore-associated protein [Yarrowia sp. C11]|nr:Kinetochore-associated protein [Yarrowia sp. E02]KAG5371599.1 Kinetochore-associated protein [Yarrowia sp. C11]
MPAPEKLQLTAEDARYLRDEFSSAVAQKTSLHLPGNDPTDPLILRVRQLVAEFVTETMQLSRHALVVDGADMSQVNSIDAHLRESTEHIEPFDMALAEELRRVYAEVDETTVRLSEMRKNVPHVISELYKQAEVDCDDIGQPTEEGVTLETVLEELPPVEELNEEEKETLRKSLLEIKRLRGAVPETLTRLEELGKVKEVVGGL